MSKEIDVICGPSTAHLLGICFVVLRLCHLIDWSWFCILLPFWLPFAIIKFLEWTLVLIKKGEAK
jgi:hypothetical protein